MAEMKTIGLVGGVSWQSTLDYYRIINELTAKRLGPAASAQMDIHSVNFAEIQNLSSSGKWDKVGEIMLRAAKRVERAGADMLLLGANTMHKFASEISREISIPLIHIIDETAKEVKKQEIRSVLLLGTKYTMTQRFYIDDLESHGLQVTVPSSDDQNYIHDIIFSELMQGVFTENRAKEFKTIVDKHLQQGVEGAILGCTEIPGLMRLVPLDFPSFDTCRIHSEAAVNMMIAGL